MSKHRRKLGQSTVELVTGIIIFVPIVLLLIDVALLAMCSTTNDSVCRESARAAAKVPPDQSEARAQQVIVTANNNAGTVANYQLSSCTATQNAYNFIQNPPQQGGIVPGEVTVNTTCQVHPLTILNVIDGGKPITFNATQTFPFTYVVPQNGSPN